MKKLGLTFLALVVAFISCDAAWAANRTLMVDETGRVVQPDLATFKTANDLAGQTAFTQHIDDPNAHGLHVIRDDISALQAGVSNATSSTAAAQQTADEALTLAQSVNSTAWKHGDTVTNSVDQIARANVDNLTQQFHSLSNEVSTNVVKKTGATMTGQLTVPKILAQMFTASGSFPLLFRGYSPSPSAGNGGDISISGGTGVSTGNKGGDVHISGGAGTYAAGGDVYISGGAGATNRGKVILSDVTQIQLGDTTISNFGQLTGNATDQVARAGISNLTVDVESLTDDVSVLQHALRTSDAVGTAGLAYQLDDSVPHNKVYDVVDYTGTETTIVVPAFHEGLPVRSIKISAKDGFANAVEVHSFAPEIEFDIVRTGTHNPPDYIDSAFHGNSVLERLYLYTTKSLGHHPYISSGGDESDPNRFKAGMFQTCTSLSYVYAPELRQAGARVFAGLSDFRIYSPSLEMAGYEAFAGTRFQPGSSPTTFCSNLWYAGPGMFSGAYASLYSPPIGEIRTTVQEFPALREVPARFMEEFGVPNRWRVAVMAHAATRVRGAAFGRGDSQGGGFTLVGFGGARVEEVDKNAFGKDNRLAEVWLPRVKRVGPGNYFTQATRIYAPECREWQGLVHAPRNTRWYETNWVDTNGVAHTMTKYYPPTNSVLEWVELGVEYLDSHAFEGCVSMHSAFLPNLQESRYGAFIGCTNLAIVYAPKQRIGGERQHYGNTRLAQGYFSSMEIIGDEMFKGCTNFTRVVDAWPDGARSGKPWRWEIAKSTITTDEYPTGYDYIVIPTNDANVWGAKNMPAASRDAASFKAVPSWEAGEPRNMRPQERIVYVPNAWYFGRSSFEGTGTEIVSVRRAKEFGGSAFRGALNLRSVTAENLEVLGAAALRMEAGAVYNTNYVNLSIPSVRWMKEQALRDMKLQKWVLYGEDPPEGGTPPNFVPGGVASTPLTFPFLQRIDDRAFYGVGDIATLRLPDTVSFGDNVFTNANVGTVEFIKNSSSLTYKGNEGQDGTLVTLLVRPGCAYSYDEVTVLEITSIPAYPMEGAYLESVITFVSPQDVGTEIHVPAYAKWIDGVVPNTLPGVAYEMSIRNGIISLRGAQ